MLDKWKLLTELPGRGRAAAKRLAYRTGLFAMLLGVYGLQAAVATPPPFMAPASQEHHPGKVIFVQLVTPDLAAAKTFYGTLFGWTFRDHPFEDTTYSEVYEQGRVVGGIIQRPIPAGQHRQPAWLTFMSAADVDAVARQATQSGGKVLFQPQTLQGLGREAVLADPQGAVFAVLSSASGDPPDVLGDPGEWIWSSLQTADPDRDAAFYQTLFNYDVYDISAGEQGQHYLLASDNYARAMVNSLPENGEHAHPYWLNFVRVEDAGQVAKQVVALGGRVLVQPRPDHQGGKIAVVADPAGAPFGLMEWPETKSKDISK